VNPSFHPCGLFCICQIIRESYLLFVKGQCRSEMIQCIPTADDPSKRCKNCVSESLYGRPQDYADDDQEAAAPLSPLMKTTDNIPNVQPNRSSFERAHKRKRDSSRSIADLVYEVEKPTPVSSPEQGLGCSNPVLCSLRSVCRGKDP
jgi:hypothetical protein